LIARAVTFEDPEGNVLGAWQPDDDLDPVRKATIEQGRVNQPPEQLVALVRGSASSRSGARTAGG
jgi:hypothetical protein